MCRHLCRDACLGTGSRPVEVRPDAGQGRKSRSNDRNHQDHAGIGVALPDADPAALRAMMAMVPQDSVIFAASARDNLRYGNWAASDDDIWEAAQAANAAEFLRKLPEGLDTYLGEGGARLSGGQRQRISIARSLVLNPQMIICDEPVSALDVSVQAQVVNLLEDLKKEFGLTLIFIAHDLAVVKNISDRIAVMYLGKICEVSGSEDLYRNPAHPYTDVLLSSIPVPDPTVAVKKISVEGEPPSPVSPPAGCRFNTRCPNATDRCRSEEPTLREVEPGHFVACHHPLFGGEAPVAVRSN